MSIAVILLLVHLFLLKQERDRTIKIEIVEGRIGEIKIVGLEKLRPEYIRSRVAIAAEPPLNRDKLLEGLQLLQLNPLIKNISAELSKGVDPGESFLRLEIEEADSFDLELGIDNRSNTSIGSVRRRVSVYNRNFLGFGDRFEASYVSTEGIKFSHGRNDSSIISEPCQDLDLESKNRIYQGTFIQTLIDKPTQDLLLGFSLTHQNTRLSLMDEPSPNLARGSDRNGRKIVSSLRFVQEYNQRSQNYVFSIRSQLAIGIDAFGSTINNNQLPDSKFLVWRGQLQYLKAVSSKTNILFRGQVQLSDRPLFSQEQFSAVGSETVRGYNRDRVSGDNGFFLSAEVHNTILRVPKWELNLEIGSFFDFGRVWNTDDLPIETSNTISSLGIIAQLAIKDNLTARIDWGFPLIDDKLPQGDSLQGHTPLNRI